MKILFSDITYSYLFPGGKQVHTEKLYQNLIKLGIEVEHETWYNPQLNGDIVHFFGFNDFEKIITLKKRGFKIIYTHIMDGLTNSAKLIQQYHSLKNKLIKTLPNKFNAMFPWRALKYFDAIVYMHENDRKTSLKLYDVDPNKSFIIPHGVDSIETFQGNYEKPKEKYLVSIGSIIPRKNSAYTAYICKNNNIPIKFIGHPFDKNSDYFKKFIKNVDNKTVQYLGFLSEEEKLKVLKTASGFVSLSLGESGCISIYEAAANGLPLLLSDLPWAKGYEEPRNISFCSIDKSRKTAKSLVDFYAQTIQQDKQTFRVRTWQEIARMYVEVYNKILSK